MNRSGRSEAKSREVDEHGEAERSPAGDDMLTAKLEAGGDLAFAQSGPEHGLRWCRMGAHLSGLVQSGSGRGPVWRPRAVRSSSEHADRSDTDSKSFRVNTRKRVDVFVSNRRDMPAQDLLRCPRRASPSRDSLRSWRSQCGEASPLRAFNATARRADSIELRETLPHIDEPNVPRTARDNPRDIEGSRFRRFQTEQPA
jgi:hypothetical protein